MLNGLDLRTNYRQNFRINTIELIKASPNNKLAKIMHGYCHGKQIINEDKWKTKRRRCTSHRTGPSLKKSYP
jgi:hypothetical protein